MPNPTPLYDADGKLVGAANMLVDVSQRKQAESRPKTLVDELNHRVNTTFASRLYAGNETQEIAALAYGL